MHIALEPKAQQNTVRINSFRNRMEFRRRHNMVYATLEAFASMETVGVVTKNGIEHTHWLGL